MVMQQLFDASGAKLADLRVRAIRQKSVVDNFLRDWTEFGPVQGWKVAFALEADGMVYGIATWGRPVARLEDQETTLQLTRFALHPQAPARSEVVFLQAMETWIRAEMKTARRLITYRDFRDESGEVFDASGWGKQVLDVSGASCTNREGRQGNERPSKVKYTKVLRRVQ